MQRDASVVIQAFLQLLRFKPSDHIGEAAFADGLFVLWWRGRKRAPAPLTRYPTE
jgi:hypothetical protein